MQKKGRKNERKKDKRNKEKRKKREYLKCQHLIQPKQEEKDNSLKMIH